MFNLRKYANIFNPYKYIKKYLYHKKQNFYYQKAMDHNQRVQERKSVGYLPSKKALRTIKTIRSVDSVNYNINGYKPLIKKLIPSEMFILLHTVIRYKNTGRIEYVADTSGSWWDMGADIIGEEYRYAYNFESPYAIYMVPVDIQIGERVILDDLIEDYVGSYCNGIPYRLGRCEAVWDGEEFDIDYDIVTVDEEVVMG